MANFICTLHGVRGSSIEIYDNKCIIKTKTTVGSLITGNVTDGEKTIFYIDCVGVQFKPSAFTIGYLQLETPSMQMNHQESNFFSENTFTFEDERDGVANNLMRKVYRFICDRIESYKYNTLPQTQSFDALISYLAANEFEFNEKILSQQSQKELEKDEQQEHEQQQRIMVLAKQMNNRNHTALLEAFIREAEHCNRASDVIQLWKTCNLE